MVMEAGQPGHTRPNGNATAAMDNSTMSSPEARSSQQTALAPHPSGDFGDIRQMMTAVQQALEDKVAAAERSEAALNRWRDDVEKQRAEMAERESRLASREATLAARERSVAVREKELLRREQREQEPRRDPRPHHHRSDWGSGPHWRDSYRQGHQEEHQWHRPRHQEEENGHSRPRHRQGDPSASPRPREQQQQQPTFTWLDVEPPSGYRSSAGRSEEQPGEREKPREKEEKEKPREREESEKPREKEQPRERPITEIAAEAAAAAAAAAATSSTWFSWDPPAPGGSSDAPEDAPEAEAAAPPEAAPSEAATGAGASSGRPKPPSDDIMARRWKPRARTERSSAPTSTSAAPQGSTGALPGSVPPPPLPPVAPPPPPGSEQPEPRAVPPPQEAPRQIISNSSNSNGGGRNDDLAELRQWLPAPSRGAASGGPRGRGAWRTRGGSRGRGRGGPLNQGGALPPPHHHHPLPPPSTASSSSPSPFVNPPEQQQELQELAAAPPEIIQKYEIAGSKYHPGNMIEIIKLLSKERVQVELGNRETQDGGLVSRVTIDKITEPSSPYCGFPGGVFSGKTLMVNFMRTKKKTRRMKKKLTIAPAADKAFHALEAYRTATAGATGQAKEVTPAEGNRGEEDAFEGGDVSDDSDIDTPLATRRQNIKQHRERPDQTSSAAEGSREAKRRRIGLKEEGSGLGETLVDVLHVDAPKLLEVLDEEGLLNDMPLLDIDTSSISSYTTLQTVLQSVCAEMPERPDRDDTKHLHAAHAAKNYSMGALRCLIQRAKAYEALEQSGGGRSQIQWGWCRELQSFLFVFEQANRIILERPEYGMASYFFEIEEPMSIPDQVARLVACMSVSGISRLDLITDKELLQGVTLSPEQEASLRACGWTQERGLASILNFCERVHHDHKMHADDWKAKIGRHIAHGADMGRPSKVYSGSAPRTSALPRVQLEKPPSAQDDKEQQPARDGNAAAPGPHPPQVANAHAAAAADTGDTSGGAADDDRQHLVAVAADLVPGSSLQPHQASPPPSRLLIAGYSMEDLD